MTRGKSGRRRQCLRLSRTHAEDVVIAHCDADVVACSGKAQPHGHIREHALASLRKDGCDNWDRQGCNVRAVGEKDVLAPQADVVSAKATSVPELY